MVFAGGWSGLNQHLQVGIVNSMMHENTRNLDSMLVISFTCGLAKQSVQIYTLEFPISNKKIAHCYQL